MSLGAVRVPVVAANGREHYPIALHSHGRIEVQFQHLKPRAPFDDEQTRLALLRRVNEIPGVAFGPEVIYQATVDPVRQRALRAAERRRFAGRLGTRWRVTAPRAALGRIYKAPGGRAGLSERSADSRSALWFAERNPLRVESE